MSLIEKVLTETILRELGCNTAEKISGGGLVPYYIYSSNRGKFFIKVGDECSIDVHAAEAQGLKSIRETKTLRVPETLYLGKIEGFSVLILEHIELFSHTPRSLGELGIGLASLHLDKGVGQFGFSMDNTIGRTLQVNTWCENWVNFFLEYRLRIQLKFIEKKYRDLEIVALGGQFLKKFASYFEGVKVVPSLLHGDLWSGNTAADEKGRAVIYDPAAYYGHHEAEFGMLTLFGGFNDLFYKGYRSLIPEVGGFENRLRGYQLYHALNHYNLFGTSYRSLCLRLLA